MATGGGRSRDGRAARAHRHDAKHKQIFTSRTWNEVAECVHSGLVGAGYRWCAGKHSRYHPNANHEDENPVVGISVPTSPGWQGEAGSPRWTTSHQAVLLFLPLPALEGFALRWHSIRHSGSERYPMITKVAMHLGMWLRCPLPPKQPLSPLCAGTCVPSTQDVHFASGHKGAPMLPMGHSLDFPHKRMLTSRDIRERVPSAAVNLLRIMGCSA
ncbi:hypothetical protein [Lentzea sp. NPDC004782]|uniref:hypothetical protein n=1 Tax=Lentzea sp. NPDC004782 TaxID=3154458 RepID=UPI0033BF5AD8